MAPIALIAPITPANSQQLTANSQQPDSEDSDIYCTFALRSLSPKCEQLTDCYLIETSPCGIHVVLDDRIGLR